MAKKPFLFSRAAAYTAFDPTAMEWSPSSGGVAQNQRREPFAALKA
jgi:hypothetical protein